MVPLSKATWSDLPNSAQRVLLRLSELGAMDRATISALCLEGERKSPAGRKDLRLSGSRLAARSALNRVARLVASKVIAYDRGFSIGRQRYYPVRANSAHQASAVLCINDCPSDVGVTAAAVARDLQDKLGFVVGRDRETVLAYSGGKCAHRYRCVRCNSKMSAVEDVPCPASDGGRCSFAPFANEHRLVADVALRVKSDGSVACALVWSDDGRAVDAQWEELLPLLKLAQEPRVRVVVRPRDGSVYSLESQRFSVLHPRLERMIALIEAAGGKATAGGDAAHRQVDEGMAREPGAAGPQAARLG